MANVWRFLTVWILFGSSLAAAQFSPAPGEGAATRTTFIRLGNQANAILVEPQTPDPLRSRIAVLVTHPGNTNNFNYFIARALPRYGYPVIAVNYYGPERSYYETMAPIAEGIKALRAMPGIEKVVLAGHSTGAAQLTAYQDVAENGAAACQRPERIYKCRSGDAEDLPKADGLMLLDGNSGAPERIIGINPAIDPWDPYRYDPSLDPFNPANGYDPDSGAANYSDEFLDRFFAAQAGRNNELIAAAQARLDLIEKGEGQYRNDEPFTVAGRGLFSSEVKPELAYINFLSRTHAPHTLLKADGTQAEQIIQLLKLPPEQMRPADTAPLYANPDLNTVRRFLSTHALRLTRDYRWTEDRILGVDWNSSPASAPGSAEGIRVPTLIMAATCAVHIVFLEAVYDHSAAKDKEYVGVEGANHGFNPCRPEYGDTFRRTFDYVDGWLSKPGRFL